MKRTRYKLLRSSSIIAFPFAAALLLAGCDMLFPGKGGPPDEVTPALELVAEGNLTAPVALAEAPDGSGRLFVADQPGRIWVIMPDGTMREEPFLDIRDRVVELNPNYDERGLLGLAFHPGYESNGRFFVHYSAPLREEAPDGYDHTARISEFRVSGNNPNEANPGSEQILLEVDEPQSNHNGGAVAFGPEDGYLYISLGDGGNRDDEGLGHVEDWYDENAGGNGQDTGDNLLGSMLRIDVDGGYPYAIPPDNPILGQQSEPDEQYAYGFRNPSEFSFDMGGRHALFVGDAGQELWEEVSLVTKGGNYGWNVREGAHCFDAENPENPPEDCPTTDPEGDPLIEPVLEFPNLKQPGGVGVTMIGGYVYRGEVLPQLDGRYIFGTWSAEGGTPAGRIFITESYPQQAGGLASIDGLRLANRPDGVLDEYLLSFGQDQDGEIYVLTYTTGGPTGNTGKVFKLVAQ